MGCTQPGSAGGLEALERVEAALEDVVVRKLHDGLFIGLAGEREIHVAEVLARKREVGVDAQGLLEVRDGFLNASQAADGQGYCVFGRVVKGQDVVDKIAEVRTGVKAGMRDVPVKPVTIVSARML